MINSPLARPQIIVEVALPLYSRSNGLMIESGVVNQVAMCDLYEIAKIASRLGAVPLDAFHTPHDLALTNKEHAFFGGSYAFEAWDRRIAEFRNWINRRFPSAEVDYSPDNVVASAEATRMFAALKPMVPPLHQEVWRITGTRLDGTKDIWPVVVHRSEAYSIAAATSAVRRHILETGRWIGVIAQPPQGGQSKGRLATVLGNTPTRDAAIVIGEGFAIPQIGELGVPVSVFTSDGEMAATFCAEPFMPALPPVIIQKITATPFEGAAADHLVFEAAKWLSNVAAVVEHVISNQRVGFTTEIDPIRTRAWIDQNRRVGRRMSMEMTG